jgi:hypothetical protein
MVIRAGPGPMIVVFPVILGSGDSKLMVCLPEKLAKVMIKEVLAAFA